MTSTDSSEIRSSEKESLIISSPRISEKKEKCSSGGDSPRILHILHNIVIYASNGLCIFMVFVSYSLFSPFFPAEAMRKGVSESIVGLIFATYSFVIFIFSPFCGVLIPKYGPRFVLYSGLVLCGGSLVLFGFCDLIVDRDAFITVSFILRATSAIGGAAAETSAMSILLGKYPDNIGTVSGVAETATGAGYAFGPVMGGFLYTVGGFKLSFVVTGGTMIAVIPILALTLGKGEEKKKKDDKESISRLKVLKIPTALMLSLCFVVCGFSFSYPEPILGPHLIEIGQNPANVGLAFLCWAATYTLLAPLVGYIGDKTKCYRTMMIAGFTVLLIGHLLVGPAPFLTFLPAKTIWLVIPAMFLYGISGALGFVPIMPELIKTLREDGMPDDSSTNALVSSIYICMYYLGSVIGPVLAGVLCDHFGFEWSMTVAGFICFFQVAGFICFFQASAQTILLPNDLSLKENTDAGRIPLLVNYVQEDNN